MSQHSSLKIDSVGIRHRNVLSRLERIKRMKAEGKWVEDRSVFNLPKLKSIKIKVKKSSTKEAKEGEGTEAKAPEGKKA